MDTAGHLTEDEARLIEDLPAVRLPEVTEIQRYRYEPGDKLIVYAPSVRYRGEIEYLKEAVSSRLQVPVGDILVVGGDIRIEVQESKSP